MPTAPKKTETAQEALSAPAEPTEAAMLPAPVEATATPVPLPEGALVPTDDEWQGVDDGDLAGDGLGLIPFLALNRKVDGGFVDPETGEKTKLVEAFVWMAKSRSRAWWPEPFGKGDAAPSCRSFDGVKADPASPDLQNSGDCTTCPHARWQNGDSPECSEAVEALWFLPDPHGFGQLRRVRFGGLALSPVRAFWDGFRARLPRRPPIAYVSRCELVETETDNGTFLVPSFQRVRELTRAEAQPLIDARESWVAEWQNRIAEDVAAGVGAEPGPFDDPQQSSSDAESAPEYAEGGEPF